MIKQWIRDACVVWAVCLTGPAVGQVSMETVLDGLNNPSGLAIQPETGHVFVSDSGALRVLRVVDGKAEDVIVGFPQDVYGTGPMYNLGPLGLLFLDRDTLVVGGGGQEDGQELLRIYRIPAAGAPPLSAAQMEASFTLPPQENIQGEGNFYALAGTPSGIYATCNGDDTKGWVARLTIAAPGSYGPYERFIATKEATDVDAPVGITISPRGELVVGQMGEVNIPQDSLLTFYSEKGELLLNLETGLNDITAVAYSPRGQLYATDFAWISAAEGGLFQLVASNDSGQQGVDARKVTALDKPTAMAFDSDGALLVTVFGTAAEGSDQPPGKLLKIAPGL